MAKGDEMEMQRFYANLSLCCPLDDFAQTQRVEGSRRKKKLLATDLLTAILRIKLISQI